MKQLYAKLKEYLSEEYSDEEIEDQLDEAKIRKVTSKQVELVYGNGVLERLKLVKGKLVGITTKIERAKY